MMSEILKMQDFNHSHVMTLMGMSFDAANTPSMVMPYMANALHGQWQPTLLPQDEQTPPSDVDKVRGC